MTGVEEQRVKNLCPRPPLGGESVIDALRVIFDAPASGPANMQRDQDLLSGLQGQPILRIYQWSGDWISYGYFQTEADAVSQFPDDHLQFVRRPTGGGLVDHRGDLTYTLLLPKVHPLVRSSRAESYRRIHEIIYLALTSAGVASHLVTEESGGGLACFAHPVPGDIIIPSSRQKIAGSAQRRSRQGLLHQGSILAPALTPQILAETFAKNARKLASHDI